MAHSPDPHRPQVLYTVSLAWWMRLLSIALALLLELAIGVPVLLALLDGDGRMMLAGLIVLPLLLAVLVITLLANLQRFTVTTTGITIRGWLGRRRIPWDEVAVVEVDRSTLGRGATVVVTRDGRRVRSELTAARYALRRGESVSDHGPDLLQPARPTRAAIQAHQEHLRRRHPGTPR
ncbi:PH domain-containing protein [Brachybacterium phenoliresistens]|uniref:Low molecular weight protein antigen 6 PH domain-containing protein n=1 Tax=Brachybacterium phenoliresistens TaxID=396014 RepID=Z9JYU0_9MICO|nr:PH domain-containing protein [Brachybacterium phenoliresistens]EWS82962.1 hypothetical protein BF93_05475 [Brachybacterium phenoliresistens]